MPTYDPIAATLAALNTVKNNPADSENPNTLGAYDRQVKNFIYDYLTKVITDDPTQPTIKAAAIPPASLAGLVSGSTSNAGTQQGIVQGTVSTPDLRDSAVSAAKLADGAVTENKLGALSVATSKLQLLSVTAAQIADATITGAKMVAKTVDTTQIADDAIQPAQIDDNAVLTAAILNGQVTPAKLANGTAEGQILVSGANPYAFAAVTMSGGASINASGVVTLANTGIVEIEERTNAGTGGGGAGATTWNLRGVTIAWTKTYDTVMSGGGASFVSLTSGQAPITVSAGTYIIAASAPGYKTGAHQIRLARYNSTNVFQEAIWGSSETAPAAANIQSRSRVEGVVTFAAGDYIKVEHYTTAAEAVDGLGVPCSSPATAGETTYEVYAQVRIQKIG